MVFVHFLKYFFVGLFLLSNLSALDFTEKENSVFFSFYRNLFETERELVSFKIKRSYVDLENRDLKTLFEIYDLKLNEIRNQILDQNIQILTPLDKNTLISMVDFLKAQLIYKSVYYVDKNKNKKLSFLRDKINEKIKTLEISREQYNYRQSDFFRDRPREEFVKFEDKVESLMYAVYSENLFWLMQEQGGSFGIDYHVEDFAFKALRLDSQNDRALLTLGLYYIYKASSDPFKNRRFLITAQRYLNKVIVLNQERVQNGPNYSQVSLYYANLWLSQLEISRLNYGKAMYYLERAERIFPQNQNSKYLRVLLKNKKNIFSHLNHSFDQTGDPSEIDFFYIHEFSFVPFQSAHYFNFLLDELIFSPYLLVGVRNDIYQFHFEEGIRYQFPSFDLKLAGVQNFLLNFNQMELAAKLDFLFYFRTTSIHLEILYGLLWEWINLGDLLQLMSTHGVKQKSEVIFQLKKNESHDIKLAFDLDHQLDLNRSVYLFSAFVNLPLYLFYTSWGEWVSRFGMGYVYSSAPETIDNSLSLYHDQPVPIVFLAQPFGQREKKKLGNWLFHFSTGYRIYLFANSRLLTGLKGVYFAPTVHVSTVHQNAFLENFDWTYSFIGNFGIRFSGGGHLSLGVGWNFNEGIAFSLFFD